MTDFAATKAMFHIPDGMIYLDGNTLGPLPKAAPARVAKAMTEEWGEMLITGWNKAGWMAKATEVGDRVAKLIGAEAGHVVMGDTLSIKVYQALASALELRPERRVISQTAATSPLISTWPKASSNLSAKATNCASSRLKRLRNTSPRTSP